MRRLPAWNGLHVLLSLIPEQSDAAAVVSAALCRWQPAGRRGYAPERPPAERRPVHCRRSPRPIHRPTRREYVMSSKLDAKARAEAVFKTKAQRHADGAQAWQEYEARTRAVAEKTERLRALRLAREANLSRRDNDLKP